MNGSTKRFCMNCEENRFIYFSCLFFFFLISVPATGHHTMDEELENKL